MIDSRYIIGIDLGTTTSAVSFIDTEEGGAIQQFGILQLADAGEVADFPLLPSFCYLPSEHELPEGALELPWSDQTPHAVGMFAREQGAAVPGRLVASAKSWLAHGGVDRTAGILPWGGDLGARSQSPVDISRYYLEHIRSAWDHRYSDARDREGTHCVLSEQQVVLTVPASFDEAARELTVKAARDAGLEHVVLLEEPLAAFYGWLWQHEDSWRDHLNTGESILVIDIGGGTSDFSLIRIEDGYTLRRTAVGEHLLLGGDNIDMALAREVEHEWGTKLPSREWSMLCHQCRMAKEALLTSRAPDDIRVTVSGSGSKLISGVRSAVLTREHVLRTFLEGFFPEVAREAEVPLRRAGVRRMGLPYVTEPAVTRHLLAFLKRSAAVSGSRLVNGVAIPDRILFNGGTTIPQVVRERLCAVVAEWGSLGKPLPELEAQDLNLSVSRGASYYGRVRRGEGVRVKGGIARSYYLEVAAEDGTELLCMVSRDTDEGKVVTPGEHQFRLVTNRTVQFPLYSSSTRLDDRAGDVITDRMELTPLPPLQTVLTYGKGVHRELEVRLRAVLSEVGTLNVWCETEDGQHRYPLSFNLRAEQSMDSLRADEAPEIVVDAACLKQAREALRDAFADIAELPHVASRLEDIIGVKRRDWGGSILRALADDLLVTPAVRGRTAEHEVRWLNLTGFCLRPGFGAAGDEWRTKQMWKVWHPGPLVCNRAQVGAEWWTCWRRIGGGLREGQQQQVGSVLLKVLFGAGNKPVVSPKGKGAQESREMWRCLGSLERLSIKQKRRILRGLLEDGDVLPAHFLWVVSRVGARQLFHGPVNAVVPAAGIEPLLPTLFSAVQGAEGQQRRMALFAIANVCRRCDLRDLDVSAHVRRQAVSVLTRYEAPDEWCQRVEVSTEESADYRAELAGERLPLGLRLTQT
ncbi:MAG: hsp70 family protein [Candidatus Pacebacteria bacterium]|nr:hsp70 family protein [Candidatus Paceibacterota bacterium]